MLGEAGHEAVGPKQHGPAGGNDTQDWGKRDGEQGTHRVMSSDGNDKHTTSLRLATSAADVATCKGNAAAADWARSVVFWGWLSNTVKDVNWKELLCFFMMFLAIPLPMKPTPTNPTRAR